MNNVSIFMLNLYSVIILLILGFHVRKNSESRTLQDNLFMAILFFAVFMLCIDTLGRFDGMTLAVFPAINEIGNFLLFMLVPVIPCLWLAYIHFLIFRKERKTKYFLRFLGAINLLYIAVFLIAQHFGWFYSIDSDNIYRRGPLILVPVLLMALLLLLAVEMAVKYRKRIEKKNFIAILFFPIPPLIGIVIQSMFYGTSFILNCFVFSLLIVFFNIQMNSMYTDYLTGVNNRMMLDTYLKEKINSSSAKDTFAAILLDINDFKHINDTFGHNVGDKALENTAKLLRKSVRARDFIARFGGDEFCIITDISNETDLDAIVNKIRKRVRIFNESNSDAYKLSFSMGYAKYDYSSRMSAEEFLKHLDDLMYEDKSIYKRDFPLLQGRSISYSHPEF